VKNQLLHARCIFQLEIDVSRLHLSKFAFDFQSEPPAVSSSWKQQGPAIVGNADYDELGRAVALSADARTLVVGAPGDDYNTDRKGYVKVYHDDEDREIHRKQLGQTIYGDATGDRFGRSVDITAEGNKEQYRPWRARAFQ